MGTGYTRNDTSNNIADGNVINASDIDGEYDAIEAAFNETTGHTHDGTAAEGAPITVLGPVQDFIASATEIKPKTTNTLDIGTNSLQFKDMYLDGTAYIDGLGEDILVATDKKVQFRDTDLFINSSVDGQLDIDANAELEITAPIVDINASTSVNISNDLKLDSDSAILSFGADSEITVTHEHNTGLKAKAASGFELNLQTSHDSIEATDVIGKITFNAPDEASGTDAILDGATIEAIAEDTFAADNNATALVFKTNTSAAATERMRIKSDGTIQMDTQVDIDNITIDGNTISSTDSNGNINLSPNGTGTVVIDTDLDVDNINVNGNTVSSTDTNGNINLSPNGTGTVIINTDLDVDNININGNTIISTDTNGNIALTPNGTGEVDISKVDIDSGAIDGTTIGASSAAAGTFTTLSASTLGSAVDLDNRNLTNADINSGTIDGTTIGASSAAAGTFTTLTASGDLTVDTDTLYVGSTNNRVGVGTTSPSTNLEIDAGSATGTHLQMTTTGASQNIDMTDSSSTSRIRNAAGLLRLGADHHNEVADSSLRFEVDGSEHVRIDSSGNVGIGTTSPSRLLDVNGTSNFGSIIYARDEIRVNTGGVTASAGSNSSADTGVRLQTGGSSHIFVSRSDQVLLINRQGTDGSLITFYAQGNSEGSISVSGSTITYGGGHLARWSRLPNDTKDTSIVKGTVMTNLDEMVVWQKDDGTIEDNEQLNKTDVSSVEGDVNVAGVFDHWDDDDDEGFDDDFYLAETGDFVIRIAQGTTVARGDLLMSAGDGTAKPQDDDIVRSKTIAKVTSTHVSHTYADGSYLVPCVLMAC